MEGLIPIRKAAGLLSVNPETLRRWDRVGKLKAVVINKRGDRRYKEKDLELFTSLHIVQRKVEKLAGDDAEKRERLALEELAVNLKNKGIKEWVGANYILSLK